MTIRIITDILSSVLNFLRKFHYFLCFLFAFLAISPRITNAQAILFQDNFDDEDISDWSVPRNECSPANWVLVNNGTVEIPNFRYGIVINKNCVTETIPLNLTIPANVAYSFEVDITMPDNSSDRNFVFKYKNSNNWYDVHLYGTMVQIQKVVGGSDLTDNFDSSTQSQFSSYTFTPGQTYHFKVEVFQSQIKLYINGALNNSLTDSEPYFTNSSAGLQASGGGDPTSEVWFDNVTVTEIASATPTPTPTPSPTSTPTPTPSPSPTASPTPTLTPTPSPTPTINPFPNLNVTDLKQYTGGWENDVYDNISGSIKQFGCALTSASMVLKYHGFSNADPKILNNWLKGEPDGYLNNGLVNWLAVSRYSFLNKTGSALALEFRRLAANDNNLINKLKNGRPAILKEPGHFIVAKSQTADSFGINDPGYADRPTLESYSDTYSAIFSYRPTSTDLSYLLLSIDSSFDFTVYGPDGNPISGFSYTEEGLNDISGGGKSGGSLNIFEYPTPETGQYRIEITGPTGLYTLKSYSYDENGDLMDNSPITTTSSSTNIYLNYDSDPDTPAVEVPAVISGQSSTTPSTSTALISWTTDKLASSRVIYDTVSHPTLDSSANYGYAYSSGTTDDILKVLFHEVLLSGLSSGQAYYYRAVSIASPASVGEEGSFQTLTAAGPPVSSSTGYTPILAAVKFYPTRITGFAKSPEPPPVLAAKTESSTFTEKNRTLITIDIAAFIGFVYLRSKIWITKKKKAR